MNQIPCDQARTGKMYSRRIKLTPQQRARIVLEHGEGSSIHSLSRLYNVSRRLIQFILYPDRYKRNLQIRKKNGGSGQYYNREYNTIQSRKHRAYKKQLIAEGKI